MSGLCEECQKLTSGKCLEHSNGRWVFYPDPQCFICGNFDDGGTILGYESCFDGEFICWDCFRKYVDPMLRKALEEK